MILESSQKQHSPSLTEPGCFSAAGPSLWAHPDHRNELTLPTTCEKNLLGDALAGRYKGTSCLMERLISPFSWRGRAVQKELTSTQQGALLHPPHPGAPT